MFEPNLKIGEVINNLELMKIFGCGIMGGMRFSKATNSLVLVSDRTKGLYEDHWQGDVLHYTGMGKVGNQYIDINQNKTLNESNQNGVSTFLFEVVTPKEYIYLGPVKLVQEPYQAQQPDDNGNLRFVWIFPVRPDDNDAVSVISHLIADKAFDFKKWKARRLSMSDLEKRARLTGKEKGSVRTSSTQTYERNAYVSEFVKRAAAGICELCNQPAPFKDTKGEPYLESHHIIWLSRGGEDTIENSVALCPNCHRKMHVLDFEADRTKLDKLRLDGESCEYNKS